MRNSTKRGNCNGVYFFIVLSLACYFLPANVHALNENDIQVTVTKKSYNGADVSCRGMADAQLTIQATGGSGNYVYSIDNGDHFQEGNVFSGLEGGKNYVVKVKDEQGLESSAKWIWVGDVNNNVTIAHIQKKWFPAGKDVSCADASDGEITISAWGGTGELQYSTDGGATFTSGNKFTGLSAGAYNIVVRDANGCQSATDQVVMEAPEPVAGEIIYKKNISCEGNENDGGEVKVKGQGGAGQYRYSLDGEAYSRNGKFKDLSEGVHTIIIKDRNGCIGTIEVNIVRGFYAEISGDSVILSGKKAELTIRIQGESNETYTAVYKNVAGQQNTVYNLKDGINVIQTDVLTVSQDFTLVSVSAAGGCSGTVAGTAHIEVMNQVTWLGLTSEWSDPDNWYSGVLPTISLDVIIPAGTANPIISDSIGSVRDIQLEAGMQLTLNNATLQISGAITGANGSVVAESGAVELLGNTEQALNGGIFLNHALKNLVISNGTGEGVSLTGNLDIYGTLNFGTTGALFNTNDLLTLKSNEEGTAMVGPVTGNSIMGKVTVERYIPVQRKGWRFISIPTHTGQTIHDAWQEGQNTGADNGTHGYGIQLTGNMGDWKARGFDAHSYGASIKTYNSSNNSWVGLSTTFAPFNHPSNAYMVFIRGDRSAGTYYSPVSSTTLRVKDELTTGDQEEINIEAGKFIAVGNPYAAPIDLREVDQSRRMFFYVWDPNLGTSYGGYQTLVKRRSGNYTAIPGGGSYDISDPNLIQSGQAFFVYNKRGGTIQIKESSKADENSQGIAFRPSGVNVGMESSITLFYIQGNEVTLVDGILQVFDATYSSEIDDMDAIKSYNSGENLSIKKQNEYLSFESLRLPQSDDTTELNLSGVKYGTYRIEWHFIQKVGMEALLVDNFLNKTIPVSTKGTLIYEFEITRDPGSYATDRFMIVYRPMAPLPVRFTGIEAKEVDDSKIEIRWTVADEVNVKHYAVERSADGMVFETIGTVPSGNAAGQYNFIDGSPIQGENYYRIRSVDVDGKTAYTPIVKASISNLKSAISISGNNLYISGPKGAYHVQVLNSLGQIFMNKRISHLKHTTITPLDIANAPKGICNIRVDGPNGISMTTRIMQ